MQSTDTKINNEIEDNKLFIYEKGFVNDNKQRIFIPDNYKYMFIKNIHENLLHPGMKRIYLTLKNYFTCRNFKEAINDIVNECQICQKAKNTSKTYGYSSGYLYSDKPFEFISSDIFGPLKSLHFKTKDETTYFYLITFTDIFSRLTKAYYLCDITSNSVKLAFQKWCNNMAFQNVFYQIKEVSISVQI
ncbi:Gypsy retrotransposon integrase-like protein 1 [Dictyocoela muelleri]|nr:Gypsy retrotransposon integrase-like protein 1 [Dictyocoela muelleri]